MLTYAVDDKISFKNLKMWQNEFLYYADVKENAHFPFIVVGNKVIENSWMFVCAVVKVFTLQIIAPAFHNARISFKTFFKVHSWFC